MKKLINEEAYQKVAESVDSGLAYQKFLELLKRQNGDVNGIKVSDKTYNLCAQSSGTLKKINALEVGKLSLMLGAGKENIDDTIDYTVGVKLNKLIGDSVEKGEILATLYVNKDIPNVSIDTIFTID